MNEPTMPNNYLEDADGPTIIGYRIVNGREQLIWGREIGSEIIESTCPASKEIAKRVANANPSLAWRVRAAIREWFDERMGQ